MLRIIFLTAFAVVSVFAEGELSILYHPDSIIFHGKDRINQSFITDLFTSVLGLSVIPSDDYETTNKVDIVDRFRLPKGLVNIVVKGIDSLPLSNYPTYPVNTDRTESDTWQDIDEILMERNANRTLIRIESPSDISSFDRLDLSEKNIRQVNQSLLQHLDLNVVADYRESLRMLELAANNIQAKNIDENGPAVYWFVVSGLSFVIDHYGADSPAVAEALNALNEPLKHISNAFVEAYQGKVVVAVLTNDGTDLSEEFHRVRRDVKQTNESPTTSESPEYSEKSINSEIKNEETEEKEKIEKIEKGEEEGNSGGGGGGGGKSIDEANEELVENSSPETINDFTESLGRELNHRGHEVHSMTGDENTNIPVQGEDSQDDDDMNLATKYSADYPAIFNITLWFGVGFLFSLIAICIAIADMDPGRDSIIYRMTSNRMKKDN